MAQMTTKQALQHQSFFSRVPRTFKATKVFSARWAAENELLRDTITVGILATPAYAREELVQRVDQLMLGGGGGGGGALHRVRKSCFHDQDCIALTRI